MPFVILLIFLFFILPLILSIIAIKKSSAAEREIVTLKAILARMHAARTESAPPRAEPVPAPAVKPLQPPPPATIVEEIKPPEPVVPPPPPKVTAPKPRPSSDLAEVMYGGKVASFAGIGLLLIGIAFLIGYAIKHAWLGPEARIIMGLLCGAVLVVLGHVAEVRGGGRLFLLARTLTGGGTAVFYFCIYAAYGIYNLINAQLAGIGLVACATAALGLAIAYRSQAVAVIGVLGAFIVPLLIGRNAPDTLFLLIYIAAINFPIILLGVYRNWQAAYNIAFGFTAYYVIALVFSYNRPWVTLLIFSFIYFLQFAGLGLLKLKEERDVNGRTLDIVRLLLNSLGLLWVLYTVFLHMQWDRWTGAAMLGVAVLHILLVRIGWKWRPSFTQDMLALLVGGLTFASLALPVQLDGAWVSVGWGIEGAILCWFALRAKIPLLQVAAILLGAVGLLKSMLFDVQFYPTPPKLFLNARFISGLISAGLLGVQGVLHARTARSIEENKRPDLWTVIPAATLIGILAVFAGDIFWTLGFESTTAWLLISFVLLVLAMSSVLLARLSPSNFLFSRFLLLSVPIMLVIAMGMITEIEDELGISLFFNMPFLALGAMAIFSVVMSRSNSWANSISSSGSGTDYSSTINIVSLASGIIIVARELYRINNGWEQTLVTMWLAGCAIALVMAGFVRKNKPHRYAGLWLFAIVTAKVMLVDLSELDGLERIIAFMGVGVLLLVLSFVYQRAAARLIDENAS